MLRKASSAAFSSSACVHSRAGKGRPSGGVDGQDADCLRDEGEAYAGVTNGFVMLDAMRGTHAADAAIDQAARILRRALHPNQASPTSRRPVA